MIDSRTFHCINYFVVGGIRSYLGVSNVPVHFFAFLSTEFAVGSKPPSRDNHRKVSSLRTQQRGQGAGHRSCDHGRRRNDAFALAATLDSREMESAYLTDLVPQPSKLVVTKAVRCWLINCF